MLTLKNSKLNSPCTLSQFAAIFENLSFQRKTIRSCEKFRHRSIGIIVQKNSNFAIEKIPNPGLLTRTSTSQKSLEPLVDDRT